MSNEVVLYDKKDSGVALISLNRPDRLNAITGELTARLKEKIDDACKDDDVNVIVLKTRCAYCSHVQKGDLWFMCCPGCVYMEWFFSNQHGQVGLMEINKW